MQLLHPIVPPPGIAKPDWEITAAIAKEVDQKLGRKRADEGYWDFANTAEVLDEARKVTPIYGGITHRRLQTEQLAWPCPTEDHPGTPYLHKGKFSRGLGRFYPAVANLPYENPDDEYPFILTTGRVLYHYHTGTLTRKSEGLDWRVPTGYVEINRTDAAALGIADGEMVRMVSRRGEVVTQARIGERVSSGVVFLSFHWRESPANILTHDEKLDPIAKIPEFKVNAVRLEKVN